MKIGLFKTVKNAKLKLTPPIPITLQVEEERGHVVLKIRGCHSAWPFRLQLPEIK